MQKELLDVIGEEGRTTLSRYNRKLQDNDGIAYYGSGRPKRVLNYYRFASVAAVHYGLRRAQIEHGGGFEDANMLFVVDAEGERFTLRIYHPECSADEIRSYLLWLSALRREANLMVLEPVPALDGSPLQLVSVEEVPEPRYCVLFRWIEGKTLFEIPEESRTPERIENYGALVARMHQHAESFVVPEWFTRPRYDREAFSRKLAELCSEEDFEHSESELAELTEIGERLLHVMDEMREERAVFGLCHNELNDANVLFHGNEAGVIDFACVWGYYLADIVRALDLSLKPSEHETFLAGYQWVRPLPERFEERSKVFREARRIERHWF